MDEFKLIDKYFRPLTNNSKESQNLQDDVALICNDQFIVSKDVMVEDVHFTLKDGAYNIANRLIRSNLSDIAASGAKPIYYLLGFCKNEKVDEKFLKDFGRALKEVNKEFNISLIGGDTVRSKSKLYFSVTIFGQKEDFILSRTKAKNKDLIFVSGHIGDAYLGRKILEKEIKTNAKDQKYLIARHYQPSPRIRLGQELVKQNLAKSAIDISDGLFADLKQLCKASNLTARIFQEKIPLSNQAKNILKNNPKISILDLCSGGDDYELIFTIKPEKLEEVAALAKKLKIPLTNIGHLEKNSNKKELVKLFENNKEIKIKKFGYEH